MGEVLIHLESVAIGSFKNPARVIIRGVDWEVRRGDFWVIVGLSGEGKSEFARFVAGLFPPAAGRYRFKGEEMPIVEEKRMGTRIKLAFVPEDGGLLAKLSVLENVMLPCLYHFGWARGDAEVHARRVLNLLNCGDLALQRVGHLRIEQRRLVSLARALMVNPEVLLLDCPLRGLDPIRARWWVEFLDHLNAGHPLLDRRPMTIITTTEYVGPWLGRGRQFAFLSGGSLKAIGDISNIEKVDDPILKAVFMS